MTEKRVNVLLVEDNPLHAKLVPRLIEGEAQLAHSVPIVVLNGMKNVMLAVNMDESGTDDCPDKAPRNTVSPNRSIHNPIWRLQAHSATWDCR